MDEQSPLTDPHFPGYDVLGQAHAWDDGTKSVVLSRLGPRPPVRFFGPEAEPTARALVDRLIGEEGEPAIPVFELVDERLFERPGDGYRYEDMPEDAEAWKSSIANLDAESRARHGRPFFDLDRIEQSGLLDEIRHQEGDWRGLPAGRTFSLWLRYCCEAFYSHPLAWNEIGFGGPAYPRGYENLGLDRREHWEVAEAVPIDPVPWAQRAEAAKKRHQANLPERNGGAGRATP